MDCRVEEGVSTCGSVWYQSVSISIFVSWRPKACLYTPSTGEFGTGVGTRDLFLGSQAG